MNNITTTSQNLYIQQGKDTKTTQSKLFYDCLRLHPFTCTHATDIIRIPQKSACRIKRKLEKKGLLWEIRKVSCPITGRTASLLTTDPNLASSSSNQLTLFSHDNK
jgi:hypothetical protein